MKKLFLLLTVFTFSIALTGCDLFNQDVVDTLSEELCRENPDHELCQLDSLDDIETSVAFELAQKAVGLAFDTTSLTCEDVFSYTNPELIDDCQQATSDFIPTGVTAVEVLEVTKDGDTYSVKIGTQNENEYFTASVTLVEVDGQIRVGSWTVSNLMTEQVTTDALTDEEIYAAFELFAADYLDDEFDDDTINNNYFNGNLTEDYFYYRSLDIEKVTDISLQIYESTEDNLYYIHIGFTLDEGSFGAFETIEITKVDSKVIFSTFDTLLTDRYPEEFVNVKDELSTLLEAFINDYLDYDVDSSDIAMNYHNQYSMRLAFEREMYKRYTNEIDVTSITEVDEDTFDVTFTFDTEFGSFVQTKTINTTKVDDQLYTDEIVFDDFTVERGRNNSVSRYIITDYFEDFFDDSISNEDLLRKYFSDSLSGYSHIDLRTAEVIDKYELNTIYFVEEDGWYVATLVAENQEDIIVRLNVLNGSNGYTLEEFDQLMSGYQSTDIREQVAINSYLTIVDILKSIERESVIEMANSMYFNGSITDQLDGYEMGTTYVSETIIYYNGDGYYYMLFPTMQGLLVLNTKNVGSNHILDYVEENPRSLEDIAVSNFVYASLDDNLSTEDIIDMINDSYSVKVHEFRTALLDSMLTGYSYELVNEMYEVYEVSVNVYVDTVTYSEEVTFTLPFVFVRDGNNVSLQITVYPSEAIAEGYVQDFWTSFLDPTVSNESLQDMYLDTISEELLALRDKVVWVDTTTPGLFDATINSFGEFNPRTGEYELTFDVSNDAETTQYVLTLAVLYTTDYETEDSYMIFTDFEAGETEILTRPVTQNELINSLEALIEQYLNTEYSDDMINDTYFGGNASSDFFDLRELDLTELESIEVVSVTDNNDDTYTVEFEFTVTNDGGTYTESIDMSATYTGGVITFSTFEFSGRASLEAVGVSYFEYLFVMYLLNEDVTNEDIRSSIPTIPQELLNFRAGIMSGETTLEFVGVVRSETVENEFSVTMRFTTNDVVEEYTFTYLVYLQGNYGYVEFITLEEPVLVTVEQLTPILEQFLLDVADELIDDATLETMFNQTVPQEFFDLRMDFQSGFLTLTLGTILPSTETPGLFDVEIIMNDGMFDFPSYYEVSATIVNDEIVVEFNGNGQTCEVDCYPEPTYEEVWAVINYVMMGLSDSSVTLEDLQMAVNNTLPTGLIDLYPYFQAGTVTFSVDPVLDYDTMYPGLYILTFTVLDAGNEIPYNYSVIAYYMDNMLYVDMVDDNMTCEVDCYLEPTYEEVWAVINGVMMGLSDPNVTIEDLQMAVNNTLPTGLIDLYPLFQAGTVGFAVSPLLETDTMYPGLYNLSFTVNDAGNEIPYSYTVVAYFMNDLLYVELIDDNMTCEFDCMVYPTENELFTVFQGFLTDLGDSTLTDEDIQMMVLYTLPDSLLQARTTLQDMSTIVTLNSVAASGLDDGWYTVEFDIEYNGVTDSYFFNVYAYRFEGVVYFEFQVEENGGGGFTESVASELEPLANEFIGYLLDSSLTDEDLQAMYSFSIPQDILDIRGDLIAGTSTLSLYVVMTVDVENGLYVFQFDLVDEFGFSPFDWPVVAYYDGEILSFMFDVQPF